MTRKVVDIETNDLLANMLDFSRLPYRLKPEARLWVVVVRDIDTKEVTTLSSCFGNTITRSQVEKAFEGATEVIAHNGIKFDLLALKLFGVLDYKIGYLDEEDTLFGKPVKFTDTLIRSRLFNPDRFGGHSLQAWGERVGDYKDDFRANCIAAGIIEKSAPKAAEFRVFSELMVSYCQQDTAVTEKVHLELEKEYVEYPRWKQPEKLENKLADIAIRRESYGFAFDRDLALWALDDLQTKMKNLADKVNPNLPPKKMNKGTLKNYTPPKVQLKQNGEPTVHMINFANKHGAEISGDLFYYKGVTRKMPFEEPIETEEVATIDDLDHVKMQLINLGWRPLEFKYRDLTKNSKKQTIPYQKRVESLDKWLDETFEGKYKRDRLEELNMGTHRATIREKLLKKLEGNKPVKIPTSPSVRTGVEKKLCENLEKLGDKVAFAKDFALYLTYRHRKSSIAGGDIEDMDFDEETPNTGFLAMYREVDGRVPTPAIEIGASCVPANTRLLTWDGYKRIVDIKVGDKVLTHEGTYQEVTDCIDNGVKPTYKVTLSNGMTLTCTSNHPFYTTEGWVRCEDLKVNDVYVYGSKEVWRDVKGFEGYKVSSWGSVVGKRGFKQKTLTSKISGRPCTVDLYTTPYKKVRKSIGRLVCEAFNGGDTTLEVRHLDGNSWNNNAENLVFGTSKENAADWKLHGSCGKVAKTNSKLTTDDVEKIKQLVLTDGKRGAHGRVAELFNISREHVRDICSGKRRVVVLNTESNYVQEFGTAKVVSVEYICDQPTFDITVEDAHSYVAEGIVVHNTNRYRHIGVCNIARASSEYGEIMRSLFGCGEGMVQFGQDAASLEARIQGHYIISFEGGAELAEQLLASKPNDIHTLNAIKLFGTAAMRDPAKSLSYALMYGASYLKLKAMLNVDDAEALRVFNEYWEAVLPLKLLKEAVEQAWKLRGSTYVVGVDGRKIRTRSKHSLLNALFQSGGVICMKYITVFLFEDLERKGYKCDVFEHSELDVAPMIEYHDEQQLAVNPKLVSYKVFDTEEDAKKFKAEWTGDQLGAIVEGKNGKFVITLPNVVSLALANSYNRAVEAVNLKVPLGHEWVVHKNWYGCH